MNEPEQKYGQIVPALRFTLPKQYTVDQFLNDVPTYVSNVVSGQFGTSLEGKFNGQPFRLVWPAGLYITREKQPLYLLLKLPQHSVSFYERLAGEEGPAFAVNHKKKEPEERSDERRRIIMVHLHDRAPEGKYAFDLEIDAQELEKLKAIAAYLKPTIFMWDKIGMVNLTKLRNTHGKGTLDSLVVPDIG